MPIDPSIPLQAKNPQIETGMNQLAMMGDAMKIGEMQRSLGVQNELRNLYSQGVDVSTPEGFNKLASIDPKTAMALRTDALKGQELIGNIKKTGVETKLKELDVQREQFGNLVFNPSNANITAHIEDSVLKGNIPAAQAQSLLAQVMPMNVDQRKKFFTDMGVKAEARYQADVTKRGQDISASTAMRGQDISASTTRRGQDMQYAPNVVANTVTDSAGNVTQFNRFGEVIGKPGAVGKPSATFEKTKALREQQSRDLTLLTKELSEITKDKGLIDQSTGSGAGRLLDTAAGFVGQSTSGSEAIAKLKPIADMVLKMVPRFEGPQSDKDTASYKEAAGQLADPSVPTATRKAAGREVLRLMKARKDQFVTESMANEGIGAGGGGGVVDFNTLK
jgi:hypothetical protein